MKRFWELHFIWLDPLLASAVAGGLIWAMHHFAVPIAGALHGERASIYGTLAGIFGALLGFAMASFSIVVGLFSNERLTVVREGPHASTLWRAFLWSSIWMALATAAPLSGLFLDRDAEAPDVTLLSIVLGASLIAAASLARCISLLAAVGHAITSRPGAPSPPEKKLPSVEN